MKRRLAIVLSACLALTTYSPLGVAAESMFGSEIEENGYFAADFVAFSGTEKSRGSE